MQTAVMPKMGDTMEEGKILRWIKHEGDAVQKGEALAEIETEKVNIEAEAFASGVLRKILAQEGETVPVGAPIALIGAADEPLPDEATGKGGATGTAEKAPQQASAGATSAANIANGATPAPAAAPAPATGTAVAEPTDGGRVFISPLARHIAAEHNLDITRIQGTGPGGRIIRD
ncbi:MAG TPA: biotin/lipoyl-containing protein, partial [Ktedonobacterales bacterium]|nr:biotin/lipoyl-containing protein [Ktedonobacterales bacterium]